MRAQNAVKSVDKAPDVAYVSIIALGIFFAVMENYDYLKGFGFMLCGAIALVTISSKRCIPKSRVTFSLIGMILLFLPMLYNSVSCFEKYGYVVIFSFLKFSVALLMVISINPNILSRAIYFVILLHTAFFLCHAVFLLFSMGSLWDNIIGLETSTNFISSLKRPTGLFDEPSLFGMTMMALLISAYLLNLRKSLNFFLLLTMSAPVFASFFAYSSSALGYFQKQVRFLLVIFLLAAVALGTLVFLERESAVKESPIMLRVLHLKYFFESPNLIKGSGFCSAYGKFDRDMGRDELRSFGLGNFKDAGQILLMVDLLGVIPSVLFFMLLFYKLNIKRFAMVIIYFAVSKVIFFSFTGWFLVAICLVSGRAGRENFRKLPISYSPRKGFKY